MKTSIFYLSLIFLLLSCAEKSGEENTPKNEIEKVIGEVCECMKGVTSLDDVNECNKSWNKVVEKYDFEKNFEEYKSYIRQYNECAMQKAMSF